MSRMETNERERHPKLVQLDRLTFQVIQQRSGGFGTVWFLHRPGGAAFHVVYGDKCAVKTFKGEEDEDEAIIEQELGNWVSLRSTYIARLIKISRLNFELAALMELMPGSLSDYVRWHGPLDEEQVKIVLHDIFNGLDYAFREHRLAHLDLKPDNLLLVSSDCPHVQISDWGISRIVAESAHSEWLKTTSGSPMADRFTQKTQFGGGTWPYMAPERFSGSWSIGPAADVFSVGIIAIELMTGQLPSMVGRSHPIALITSHQYFDHAKYLLRERDAKLAELLLRMLDPDPKRRPQEYPELTAALAKT